jgi:3-oxoacyl-[acyl-carrier protein] reductase
VAQYGVTVNNLLPGPFDTDRLKKTMEGGAKKAGISIEEMAARRAAANPSRRFGEPAEFGATCAFLCSKQAAYMTGQNVLLDGGAYPGTF